MSGCCMTLDIFLSFKTENTQRAYRQAISSLESYLNREAKTCSQSEALDYLSKYKRNHSDASLKHRYHILRSYFEYLVDSGEIDRNPFRIAKSLISMRQQNQVRPTKTLTPKQVTEILKALDLTDPHQRLVFAFIAFLFGGGLRRGEALSLSPSNLKLAANKGQSYVELRYTKAGITQIQPIPSWIKPVLQEILVDRIEHGVSSKAPLFPWSESTAYRHCKRAAENAGIECAPHAFRAAAATLLKLDGLEDREVAEFLRHKTLTMVKFYDHRFREASQKTKQSLEKFFTKKKKVS